MTSATGFRGSMTMSLLTSGREKLSIVAAHRKRNKAPSKQPRISMLKGRHGVSDKQSDGSEGTF